MRRSDCYRKALVLGACFVASSCALRHGSSGAGTDLGHALATSHADVTYGPEARGARVDIGTPGLLNNDSQPIELRSITLQGLPHGRASVIDTEIYDARQTDGFVIVLKGNLRREWPKLYLHPLRVDGYVLPAHSRGLIYGVVSTRLTKVGPVRITGAVVTYDEAGRTFTQTLPLNIRLEVRREVA
jgi:hypothetical protein